MSNIVVLNYQGESFSFTREGWICATEIALKRHKEVNDWLYQRDVVEYICALAEAITGKTGFLKEFNEIKKLNGNSAASKAKLLRLVKRTGLVKTKAGAPENGGGTWLHPKLGVAFARWLDVHFAVWVDLQADTLIRGRNDWRKLRSTAASSFKVMEDVLKIVRDNAGKTTCAHHYINEARLVNWALTGEFKGLDRDSLPPSELVLLASLEERNAVLLARGLPYAARKTMLEQHAIDWRSSHQAQIERAA